MKDNKRKIKEHLLLILLLGGIYGIIDTGNFNIGYFVGSGLGLIFLSMPCGYIFSFITGKIFNREKNFDSDLLDFEEDELEKNLVKKLRPFKYGVYFALFFFVILSFEKVTMQIFYLNQ